MIGRTVGDHHWSAFLRVQQGSFGSNKFQHVPTTAFQRNGYSIGYTIYRLVDFSFSRVWINLGPPKTEITNEQGQEDHIGRLSTAR
jgi:hypothetical protein